MTPWTPAQLIAYRDRILGINDRHKQWALRRLAELKHDPLALPFHVSNYVLSMQSAKEQIVGFPWSTP